MKEIISKERLAETGVRTIVCDEKNEQAAIELAMDEAQEVANITGEEAGVVRNHTMEVVGKAFPVPKTKAFSFVGLKDPGRDSKAADYFAIFHHTDFKGDKTND